MRRYDEWFMVLSATMALIIVAAFTWAYGQMKCVSVAIAHAHPPRYTLPTMLLQYWWLGLVVAILVVAVGGFAALKGRHTIANLICGVAWLIVLATLCLVLLAWELEEVPPTTPLK